MANYSYDESGNMAAYFALSVLVLILVPLTISVLTPKTKKHVNRKEGCTCAPCRDNQKRLKSRMPSVTFRKRYVVLGLGWAAVAALVYKVANATTENTLYDPFEILGIARDVTEKEIKSHYKKLSKLYHPDKIKESAEETLDMIQDRFVKITKAYKSLTDEVTRENWQKYNDPDGPQQTTVGIAIPEWVISTQNNIFVLGFYALILLVGLPCLVYKWSTTNSAKTKDGIQARSAAAFFKSLTEGTASEQAILQILVKAYQFERTPVKGAAEKAAALKDLERALIENVGGEKKWESWIGTGAADEQQKRALVLIYSHLARLDVTDADLKKEQEQLLLASPLLLSALQTIAITRSWYLPTAAIVGLQASLAQAVLPSPPLTTAEQQLLQYPSVTSSDIKTLTGADQNVAGLIKKLDGAGDTRVADVKKAAETWGKAEIVEARFRVIGERIVTPSSIVHLVAKLRLRPPLGAPPVEKDDSKASAKRTEQREYDFLIGKTDAESLETIGAPESGLAHAPLWPLPRKPAFYLILADPRQHKMVVPPLKVMDVPYASDADYRSYKIQFQAPPNVGEFHWSVRLLSDTYIGEFQEQDIVLKIDDVSALNAEERDEEEDDISDPEEDSLAGQMAVMRGGKVKPIGEYDDDDDESSTDDDRSSEEESDSDSDSD
ncbi:Sec63 Brl domain-containing protein [Schizophyllum amplum]|uniref:Sec63 Brl domain-containing protein n=1 Tax=Schizophyllum amplum TaxID=97359 RepID=A0A550CUZ7_9AGAR|nr:Sec63 Brl domain-containing protein [Auriculariopsis ampla]